MVRDSFGRSLLRSFRSDEEALVDALVEQAWRLSAVGGGDAAIVGIVANRVRRARRVFSAIQTRLRTERPEIANATALLIGRTRELDRQRVLTDLLPRIAAQRSARDDAPLFVVATQCIEAGADLDFDALITEVAPLDSLRQRFGRLNRLGRRPEALAAVVGRTEDVGARGKPDPIYGEATKSTWRLLREKAKKVGKGKSAREVVDFGVRASEEWLPSRSEIAAYVPPRANAPVLMPAFIDQWVMTSPLPAVEPEIALFLHGPERSADVQIVWRSDLDDARDDEDIRALLAACPPSTLEAVTVPIGEAKRWLAGRSAGDIADLEGSAQEDAPSSLQPPRTCWRWRGGDDPSTKSVRPHEIVPGDVLVVSTTEGGCDAWGWAPEREDVASDLARDANRVQRARDILRLTPGAVRAAIVTELPAFDAAALHRRLASLVSIVDGLVDSSDREVVETLEGAMALPPSYAAFFDEPGGPAKVHRAHDGRPIAVERRLSSRRSGDATTEDDESSLSSVPVVLSVHSRGVRGQAAQYAKQLAMPDDVAADIELAAFLHDAGKAHPSFKMWLYGGDEVAAVVGPALAKSGRVTLDGDARRRARLPSGARHEVASLAAARAHREFAKAKDPELVLWLIGTHHGWGRPFFPPVEWPVASGSFEFDLGDGIHDANPAASLPELTSEWLEMEQRLRRRYGPWGLARLEAILRLADHRRSEAEQLGKGGA